MNPIRAAIERPVAVMAVVIMAVLFGALALTRIPIQLAPEVSKPVIVITTNWPGAAPAEVEREIVNKQEEQFKGLDGLSRMISNSSTGRAELTLEFEIGANMDRSLVLVSNRLDRVSGYPAEASEPVIDGSGSEDSPSAWFILTRAEGATRPIEQYGDFANDVIGERFSRIDGVGTVNVYGGVERQLEIIFDPQLLASYGVTVPQLLEALRRANISASAGGVDEGKRRYVVRTEGQLNTVPALEAVVVRSGEQGVAGTAGGRVYVRDIADVRFGFKEPGARIRSKGEPAMAINIVRETGANVIEVMDEARKVLAELQAGPIAQQGLVLTQVYDETIYIDGAIDLVLSNIVIGGVLAAMILLLFLRSGRATLVVSLAIPVSIVASFVAMAALGRTLNVISLAGIAFAVGMVVDAAIVVLENIYRLRQRGLSPREAAYRGAAEVWGAILVSALTTVLVFVPILIMELEAGQLFRDIAVAISVSVLLSLVVAVTVIPALASRLLVGKSSSSEGEALKVLPLPIIDHLGRGFAAIVNAYTRLTTRYRFIGVVIVSAITAVAVWGAITYAPKREYLPEGNRNLVIGFVSPPQGYNLETTFEIASRLERVARPMWERGEQLVAAARAANPDDPELAKAQPELRDTAEGNPALNNFFFVALRGFTIVGGAATDPSRAGELSRAFSPIIFSEPGTFGFLRQASIFGRGVGGARAIELDITGQNLEQILAVAQRAAGKVARLFPRSQGFGFRPLPGGLALGAPELRVLPDRIRLADAGVDARTLALTIDAYNDGVRVDEITVGAEQLDLMLMGKAAEEGAAQRTQDINGFPVVTPSGRIVPVSALAEVALTGGPTAIRHTERRRTVTLVITLPQIKPLEEALDEVSARIVDELRSEGVPPGVSMSLSGAADQLEATWTELQYDLVLALAIVFLVMAILFESFLLPLVILITVPVAAGGGVAGLVALNMLDPSKPQPLDMLTMLGFVILVGIVVNNAILIVHQALNHQKYDGMNAIDAIRESVRNRTRPIFMSTLTSVFGMAPLVLVPGPGSELYRGLGTVVVGGLSLSAVLTLLLTPPLLRLVLRDRPTVAARAPAPAVAAPAE